MSLAEAVIDGITKAQAALGNLVVDCTLKSHPVKNYNLTTGLNETTYTDQTIKCVIDTFAFKEIDGDLVREDDVKLIVFNLDGLVDVTTSDRVSINSELYEVMKVMKQFVGLTSPVLMLQLRK